MRLIDFLDHRVALPGKPGVIPGALSGHYIFTWAGFGGGYPVPPVNYCLPSEFLADGSYAANYGPAVVDADVVAIDFEHWQYSTDQCPLESTMSVPGQFNCPIPGPEDPQYDSIQNRLQTSADFRHQINGEYVFYNYGYVLNTYKKGNLCYEPEISETQDAIIKSGYVTWNEWPAGSPKTAFDSPLPLIMNGGRQLRESSPNLRRYLNTSFAYISQNSDMAMVIPAEDWEVCVRYIAHYWDGLALWYYNNKSHDIPWDDPDIQARIAAIQTVVDAVWSNVVAEASGVDMSWSNVLAFEFSLTPHPSPDPSEGGPLSLDLTLRI